jgi:hypothetical protein
LSEFGLEFRDVRKKGHLFYDIISFQKLLASPSIDITVGKLEAAQSVTIAYQETAGLNI